MLPMLLPFILAFVCLLLLNIPVAVTVCLATLIALVAGNFEGTVIIASKLANGVDSFTLLAIPFFIFTGFLMGEGGMARRLMELAAALLGRFKGGLALANTVTCMLFGSVSGSAAAAVSSVGSFMLPEMRRKGYPQNFNVALTATASTTGLVIPPSNVMIVYAVAAGGVSIAELFLAGILPGILIGLGLCLVCVIASHRNDFPAEPPVPFKTVLMAFKRAILSLTLMVVVLGGILGGFYTATEAAACGVAYALLLTLVIYRSVQLKQLPVILLKTGQTTAIVMFMIGASVAMSWMLTAINVPQALSDLMLSITENKWALLLLINLLLLGVGIFMDITPALLIFTPILLPVSQALGLDPVHFGIIMIANLCIGLCTPPVGTCLFVGCSVGKTDLAEVTPAMLPFFGIMILTLLIITLLPELSLALPGYFQ